MSKPKKAKKRSPAKRAKRKKQRTQKAKNAGKRRADRALLGRAADMNAEELAAHIAKLEDELATKQSVTSGLDYPGGRQMLVFDIDYLNGRIALLRAELELLT